MAIRVAREDDLITITLEEQFDYTCRESFQKIYKNQPKNRKYLLDFEAVRFIDSSALGFLLILREHNGGDGAQIHLVNCGSVVRELLEAVKCTHLFDMDSQKLKVPDKMEQEEADLAKGFQDLLKRRKRL